MLFGAYDRVEVAHLLANECADNLGIPRIDRTALLERVRFAVLKMRGGSTTGLKAEIESAKLDWRAVVRRAGFAAARNAHLEWYPVAETALAAEARKAKRR